MALFDDTYKCHDYSSQGGKTREGKQEADRLEDRRSESER
jgi:hypothetical protein